MRKVIYYLIGLGFGLIPTHLIAQSLIASFEKEDDFKNIVVTPGVEVSRSNYFPALGSYSCKVVFPENGGKISFNEIKTFLNNSVEGGTNGLNDNVLLLFVWSGKATDITLTITGADGLALNKQYPVKQGANHIQFHLNDNGNLFPIESICIGGANSDLFFDYLSLDTYQPVLDHMGRWDAEYSEKIESPHYSWGSGLANGPIKSFSISPVFDGRGIIELAERLDLETNVVTIDRAEGGDKWGFGDFYGRRSTGSNITKANAFSLAHNYIASDLLYGPEYDVIIWPGLHSWESYPVQLRNALLDRIKKGTGLVLLFPVSDEPGSDGLWSISPLISTLAGKSQSRIPDREMSEWPANLDSSQWKPVKDHYITRGVLFDAFPWKHIGVYPYSENKGELLLKTTAGNPVLAVGSYGKGRVVALAYPEIGLIPRVDNIWETGLNYPYWEYMWSFLAKAVIWASDKEPEIHIGRAVQDRNGITVDLVNVSKKLTLFVQITDDFGTTEEEISVSVNAKQNSTPISFKKKLKGGKHLVNIQLKEEGKVFDWYSLMIEVPISGEIFSLENNESEISVGREVRTRVTLKSDIPVKGNLVAHLYDNYGRLVDKNITEVSFKGTKSFSTTLNSKDVLTHLGRSEFLLMADGEQLDRKVKELFFLQPRIWDDYDVTMYHFGPEPIPGTWETVDRQLRELNVTTLAAYTISNSKHANYKMQAQTRIKGVESPDRGPDLEYYDSIKARYLKTGDKMILKRKYGLKDSAYLNSIRTNLTSMINDWKKFSPSAYYIYEEPSVTRYDDPLDLCFRQSTLDSMRNWLKEIYGNLGELNKQWGTNYVSWPEVVPDDVFEARKRENFSSWADHRTFMENCWADQFKFVQNIVNVTDPGGLVQLSGTQAASSHNGYDYSKINQYVGQMNPYDIDNQLEYHLNFNPDLKISGQAGYGALGKGVVYDFYNHLFLKETGGSYVFWQVSCLNPDLNICQSGLDMKTGFDELLKRGIGRLVSSYQPENELRVAIHFSYPSVHAAWIADGIIDTIPDDENNSETLLQFNRNRDGWVKILHDAGIGFNFISYSNIEKGGLIENGYKVLILPMSMALSNEEIINIKKFVKQGGILIADAFPGIMDNHTKFREERALADVFGINPRRFNSSEIITPKSEPGLKIITAESLLIENENLQLLENKFGDGKAYLLNYFMEKYPEEKLIRKNLESLTKLKKIFDNEVLRPDINIASPAGAPEFSIEKYVLSGAGGVRLLGLLPGKNGKDRDVVIQLKEPSHLYDIRNKKYLGRANEFKVSIKNSVPELFCILRSKIEDLKISASTLVTTGESIILDFNINGENNSTLNSVAVIEVFNPKGEKVNYYSKNCNIINGSGSNRFNIALNDQKGIWRICLTEVISNIQKEVFITVK